MLSTIAVLKESAAGVETGELCRRHGITRACYYRWKNIIKGVEGFATLAVDVEKPMSPSLKLREKLSLS